MQSWLRSINVLNMLLLTVVAGMLFLTIQSFSHPQIEPIISEKKEVPAESLIEVMNMKHRPCRLSDHRGTERLSSAEDHTDGEQMEAVPRPEIVLYGTTITSDTAFAYIEDKKNPHSSTGGEKDRKS
jgi:hypothetical protein